MGRFVVRRAPFLPVDSYFFLLFFSSRRAPAGAEREAEARAAGPRSGPALDTYIANFSSAATTKLVLRRVMRDSSPPGDARQ